MAPRMKNVFSLALFFCCFVLVACQLNLDVDEQKQRISLTPKEAKVLLRVKRGWGKFRKKLNPFERREEAKEARDRAVRAERSREAVVLQQRRDRECPQLCWAGWSAFSNCTHSCGGAGMRTRTRRVKNAAELGWLCASWVAARGCAGNTVENHACNRFCSNGGTPVAAGCDCPAGWTDDCCATRITCPDPGRPVNGLTTPNGAGLHYGTEVQFSCNQGYDLQGSSSRTCTGTGTWTNTVPTCQIVSCGDPGTPPNSDLEVISGEGFVYETSVRVSCRHGYRLSGAAVRRCEADGNWAGVAPSCSQIVCGDDLTPTHGKVVYPSGKTLDAEAQYSCESGYVLVGAATRKCMSTGQWTGQVPSCQQITCRSLRAPVYGSVTYSNLVEGKSSFGGTATFSCQSGYDIQGASTLTCQGPALQGKWSGVQPTCQAVNCGDPGSPNHGVRYGGNFTFSASISFKCSPGYSLRGSATSRCKADGTWASAKPECIACPVNRFKEGTNAEDSCESCPANSNTNRATAVTARINCICSEGYRGGPGGPCVQIKCPALPTPANAVRKSCENNFESKCEFECKPGHVVNSGTPVRTCSGNGWSGETLVCSACPKNTYRAGPSQCKSCPDHSGTVGTGNEKSGCVCNAGWSGPAGGPCVDVNECAVNNGGCDQTCINEIGSRRCECSGAGWVKDAENPTKCNPKNQCPAMQVPAHGGLVCHSHKATNSERCQVKCNKGYEHFTRPNAFEECGPSTNWKWNHEIQEKPILDCVEAWFEEVIIEMDVFYFTDQCSTLTSIQELNIVREFVQFLNSKGVCTVGGEEICGVGDVRIECSSATKKRSTRQKLIIKFNLKSMVKSHAEAGAECDSNCREDYMDLSKTKMREASQNVQNVVQATITRPTGSTGESPSVTLGGISLTPLEILPGNIQTVCATGMIRKNSTCVACPSGSYAVKGSSHCTLCPLGSFQPNDGQTICLPCRKASSRGSKSCN